MPAKSIHQYLKANGEKRDVEIAEALGLSLNVARQHLSELVTRDEIMSCHSIRFADGKKIEGMTYRIAGFIPKNKPGAKSKVQLKLSKQEIQFTFYSNIYSHMTRADYNLSFR